MKIIVFMFALAQVVGATNKTDLLLNGGNSKVCHISMSKLADLENLVMKPGDLGLVHVDVSHLLYDDSIDDFDLMMLIQGKHYSRPSVLDGTAISTHWQEARYYNEKNADRLELINLFKADGLGEATFSTDRTYRVPVGREEMGVTQLEILSSIIDFRNELLEKGYNAESWAEFLQRTFPHADTNVMKTIIGEIADRESGKTLDELIDIANKRIEDFRDALSPLIYENARMHGNLLPVTVSKSKRSGGQWNDIHHVRPVTSRTNIQALVGDLVVVETVRRSGITPDGYKHKYNPPTTRHENMFPIYKESLDKEILPNDLSYSRMKYYYLADKPGAAKIDVSTSGLNVHPEKDPVWKKVIQIEVSE